VTGGNRGLGREVCRQLAAEGLRVVLTARRLDTAEAVAGELATTGTVVPETLDVGDPASVIACAARLAERDIAIDVLVNNAAVYPPASPLTIDDDALDDVIAINLLGPWRTCRAWVPGMVERGYGRVVNVSSGDGSMTDGLSGPAGYAVSKVALNGLTRKIAQVARGDVLVNAVCPGWVRTDMGGAAAPRSVEDGAAGITWLALLATGGPTGGFYRDRERLPW
jgi:NAD(P)-dependent dehydrogenase (short-subunit alcohol dehydrogenase family)